MMTKRAIVLYVYWVLLMLAYVAQADADITSISDSTIENGQSITVYDISSGFGSKTTASPIRFDDFEDATVGDDVDTATGYYSSRSSDTNRSTISEENNRNGSAKNLKSILNTALDNPKFWRNNVGFADTGKIFVSVWVKWAWPNWDGGTQYEATQTKIIRTAVSINDSGDVTYPMMACYNWMANDYSYTWNTFNASYSAGMGSYSIAFPNDSFVDGEWQNIVMQVDQGTKGGADGAIYHWVSKQGSAYISSSNNGTGKMVIDSAGEYMDAFKIDNYLDANNDTLISSGYNLSSVLYWDDLYIDNSWARIEIGDNADYDSCTHREMQIPTSWAPYQVSFTVNQGSFSDGDAVYIFVVGEDGTATDGYPTTFASAGSTTRYYLDADGDGYSPGDYQDAESDPGETWYTEGELTSIILVDCDDSNASINPGATETHCDGIDQDCDGSDLCVALVSVDITSSSTSSTSSYVLIYTVTAPSGETVTGSTVNSVSVPCYDGACDEQVEEFRSNQTLSVGSGNTFTVWGTASDETNNFDAITVTYTPPLSGSSVSGAAVVGTVIQ